MMLEHEYETMRRVEDRHWWYRTLRDRVASELIQGSENRSTFNILDNGCGTGGMLERLRLEDRPKWCLFGMDLSPQAVTICRERGIEGVEEGDASKLPFDTSFFDAVLSLDVIVCGAVNEQEALSECFRVLRPGGILVLNCAAYDCLRGSHDLAVGAVRRYTPARLRRLLEVNGFQITTLHGWNAWALPLIAVWRRLSRNRDEFNSNNVKSDLFQLPHLVNSTLFSIAALDMTVCRTFGFPIGTSLYAVAKKPASCNH